LVASCAHQAAYGNWIEGECGEKSERDFVRDARDRRCYSGGGRDESEEF
jgi:hypothetical protein